MARLNVPLPSRAFAAEADAPLNLGLDEEEVVWTGDSVGQGFGLLSGKSNTKGFGSGSLEGLFGNMKGGIGLDSIDWTCRLWYVRSYQCSLLIAPLLLLRSRPLLLTLDYFTCHLILIHTLILKHPTISLFSFFHYHYPLLVTVSPAFQSPVIPAQFPFFAVLLLGRAGHVPMSQCLNVSVSMSCISVLTPDCN